MALTSAIHRTFCFLIISSLFVCLFFCLLNCMLDMMLLLPISFASIFWFYVMCCRCCLNFIFLEIVILCAHNIFLFVYIMNRIIQFVKVFLQVNYQRYKFENNRRVERARYCKTIFSLFFIFKCYMLQNKKLIFYLYVM